MGIQGCIQLVRMRRFGVMSCALLEAVIRDLARSLTAEMGHFKTKGQLVLGQVI